MDISALVSCEARELSFSEDVCEQLVCALSPVCQTFKEPLDLGTYFFDVSDDHPFLLLAFVITP